MVEDFDFDMGINPKEIFSGKNWKAKGSINLNQALSIAGGLAMNTDLSKDSFEELLYENFMKLTVSVNGLGVKQYSETAKARIQAEDRKTKIQVDGNQ